MKEVRFLPKMRESVAVQFEATASQEIGKAGTAFQAGSQRQMENGPCRTFPTIVAQQETSMTDDQIKHMVNRFLLWKLPENFSPDAGISFKREYNENTPYPMKHEPVGTNLLDYKQAEVMVRHMIEDLPTPEANEEIEALKARVAEIERLLKPLFYPHL